MIVCTKCGTTSPDGIKFCGSCGTVVIASDSQSEGNNSSIGGTVPQRAPYIIDPKSMENYVAPEELFGNQQQSVPQKPRKQSPPPKPHQSDSPPSKAYILPLLIFILGIVLIILSVGNDIQVVLEDEVEEASFGMNQKELAYIAIALSAFTILTCIFSGRRVSYMFHDRKVLERHDLLNPDTPLGSAAKIAIGIPLFIVFLIIIINTILKIAIKSATNVAKTIGGESGGELYSAIGGILLILGSYMLFQILAEKKHPNNVLTGWGRGIKSGMDFTHRGVKRVEKEKQKAKVRMETQMQATSEAYQRVASTMPSGKTMTDFIPGALKSTKHIQQMPPQQSFPLPQEYQQPMPPHPQQLRCPHCGNMVDSEWIMCPNCNKMLSEEKPSIESQPGCPYCRELINPAWIMCPNCNKMLSEEV